MDRYRVYADRKIGLWLTEPELIGTTDLNEWNQLADTEDIHYDVFQHEGINCAIEVHWSKDTEKE